MATSSALAASPTFTRDIAPIVFENCSGCHRPGQSAPFSLLTFEDCAKRARQIAELTANRQMPPWLPDPAYQHYEGERLLTQKQISLFAEWGAAGAPEGNPSDLPKVPSWPEGWTLGKPDLVVQTPAYEVPAGGRDIYRNFVVRMPNTQTQYVAAVEFDPGNRTVSHHAFIRFDRTTNSREHDERDPLPGWDGMDLPGTAQSPDGHFLSWQPGKRFSMNPEGLSWRLHPNSDLVLQMHLQPSGKPEALQPSIAFYFTDKPPTKSAQKIVLTSYDIDIAPGERSYVVTNSFKLPVDVDILSVLPHAHYLGKELQGYVLLPDGRTNWLLRIPEWNFSWQGDYRLKTPVYAPRGSKLVMRFTYDNSTNNPHNPNQPPARVKYGVETKNEMAELWIQALPRNQFELARLRQEVEKQTIDFGIDYARYLLREDPKNGKAHLKYAQSLLAKGNRREAREHLNAALESEPGNDEVHYNLGLIARLEKQPERALKHFSDAVRFNPRHSRAFGNLGLIHLEAQKVEAAKTNFLRAVDINPLDAISHDALGVIYAGQGQLKLAEAHLRAAANADPSDPEIQAHLAQFQAALKRK